LRVAGEAKKDQLNEMNVKGNFNYGVGAKIETVSKLVD
jgi:hypothetical protein